jgi:hypothetical protein
VPNATCTRCGKTKPRAQFPTRKDRACGIRSQCKLCERERSRRKKIRTYWRDPVKNAARTKEWRDNNRDRWLKIQRNSELKKSYGITLNQKDELINKQKHKCAICETTDPGTKGWCVDHCHKTKVIRGILCNFCNLMLGYARDNTATLAKAAKYLGVFG